MKYNRSDGGRQTGIRKGSGGPAFLCEPQRPPFSALKLKWPICSSYKLVRRLKIRDPHMLTIPQ